MSSIFPLFIADMLKFNFNLNFMTTWWISGQNFFLRTKKVCPFKFLDVYMIDIRKKLITSQFEEKTFGQKKSVNWADLAQLCQVSAVYNRCHGTPEHSRSVPRKMSMVQRFSMLPRNTWTLQNRSSTDVHGPRFSMLPRHTWTRFNDTGFHTSLV